MARVMIRAAPAEPVRAPPLQTLRLRAVQMERPRGSTRAVVTRVARGQWVLRGPRGLRGSRGLRGPRVLRVVGPVARAAGRTQCSSMDSRVRWVMSASLLTGLSADSRLSRPEGALGSSVPDRGTAPSGSSVRPGDCTAPGTLSAYLRRRWRRATPLSNAPHAEAPPHTAFDVSEPSANVGSLGEAAVAAFGDDLQPDAKRR